MTRLPQEPSDRDVDEFVDRLERQAADTSPAARTEFNALRRYHDKQRDQLCDRDHEIFNLQDELSAAECHVHEIRALEVIASGVLCESVNSNTERKRKRA